MVSTERDHFFNLDYVILATVLLLMIGQKMAFAQGVMRMPV